MEKVWQNTDLLRLIYSFGYPEHRKHMKHIVQYFRKKVKKIKFNLRCLRRDFALYNASHNYISSLDRMLPELLTQTEQYILLHQMIDCRCCSRHSHGKPVRSRLWLNENSSYGHHDNIDCECWCRHMSRILNHSIQHYETTLTCRKDPQYITPYELYT